MNTKLKEGRRYRYEKNVIIEKDVLSVMKWLWRIIAPYNTQVKAIDKEIADIDHATVHKY